jgi:hypothetical protein
MWTSDALFNGDLKADAFEAPCQFARGTFRVQLVEVIAAAFLVFRSIADDRPRDGENPVGDRNGGFLESPAMCDAFEQSSQEKVFGTRRGPPTLHQNAAQVTIALAGTSRKPFAGAFGISRTQSSPAGRTRSTGELFHVSAEFGHNDPCHRFIDARNRAQPPQQIFVGQELFAKPGIDTSQFHVQPLELLKQTGENPAEVRIGQSIQSENQIRRLLFQSSQCQFDQFFWLLRAFCNPSENRATALADDAAGNGTELDVCRFQ